MLRLPRGARGEDGEAGRAGGRMCAPVGFYQGG